LIIPLALLPLPVAAYCWYLISAASILAAAWMAAGLGCRVIQPDGESCGARLIITAGALLMLIRFVLDNFDFGQVNTMVAALAVSHVYYYAKGKRTVSALALALAVSIKLTPAILILYHLAKLRLKFVAACAGLLVAVSVLSFLPFGSRGPDAFTTFVDRTVKNGQGFDLAFSGNQSLRGAVARLTESSDEKPDMYGGRSTRRPTSGLTLAISAALVALAVLTAAIARTEMAAASPFFCCFVLLSPLSWKAHFVALIFPVAYLITLAIKATGKRRAYIIAVLIAVFALFNVTSPRLFGPEWGEWTDAHSLVCAGALLTCFASVWQATRRFVNLR
jgi:alpha-1,2-mannosyltransferase